MSVSGQVCGFEHVAPARDERPALIPENEHHGAGLAARVRDLEATVDSLCKTLRPALARIAALERLVGR